MELPREPTDNPEESTNHESDKYDIGLKKIILADAMRTFHTQVLENGMLAQAIATTKHGESLAEYTPGLFADPDIEPVIRIEGSGAQESSTAGLCLRSSTDTVPDTSDYRIVEQLFIPLCHAEPNEHGEIETYANSYFANLALGRNTEIAPPTYQEFSRLIEAITTVLQGINNIFSHCEQRGIELTADPFGRIMVLEEADGIGK
ncbi:hypothetical protein CR983_03220 [Candidatus Saccharibacteria bacterium]|nr:MAG: hypothetical protein CR983_03220 [Candidatus Saccharibacteria bacterium]